MKTCLKRLSVCSAALVVSACGTLFGGTVSGSWTCKAPEGESCASIESIDGTQPGDGEPADLVPKMLKPRLQLATGSKKAVEESKFTPPADDLPARTAEVVARIVFPPFVDEDGTRYGRSEAFAVMEGGRWAEGD